MFGVQFDLVLTIPVQTRRAAVPQNYNTSQLKDNVPFDKQTCSGSQIKYILFCHVPWWSELSAFYLNPVFSQKVTSI